MATLFAPVTSRKGREGVGGICLNEFSFTTEMFVTLLMVLVNILSKAVVPKVCSADHQWSARLAQVVRESQYKPIF